MNKGNEMALSEFEIKRIEKIVGGFVERIRPPMEKRSQRDISYRIENQNVEIFEVRPKWNDPSTKIEPPVAKATFVKSRKMWKLYWMREDMKWHCYEPFPEARNLEEILSTIGEDVHGCFWG